MKLTLKLMPKAINKASDLSVSVSEFVALVNQTLDYAYPGVVITGELANIRVSKNRWLYFDLKDELAAVKFFGTVYHLPGPLEDGMMLKVKGVPRLHPQYGFSVNVQTIQAAGEGSIKKAEELLKAKLAAEGLFDEERKRPLPYPPAKIGLITSKESAAYADFTKIINARWGGVHVELIDVQVQGDVAPEQIVEAIAHFNQTAEVPDALVIIRGGGSAEDLQAFSTESVVRAVAASRIPTMVAIGHEIDISLAELAADKRASTPSNAAEMLVPDRKHVLLMLEEAKRQLLHQAKNISSTSRQRLNQQTEILNSTIKHLLTQERQSLGSRRQLLDALNPEAILRRGYAIVRKDKRVVRSARQLNKGDIVDIQFSDNHTVATVNDIYERDN